jgi:dolichol-phosphate mannosyltransferase
MDNFFVSVIIPVYNEEKNIKPLLHRLIPVIEKYSYEIIFVDDGSKDTTAKSIQIEIQKNFHIKLLTFLRNFGHQMALTAGYEFAKGDCVISIDADLQDPPEIIPDMIEKWKQGIEVVYAKRKKRENDSFFKKHTAQLFYYFINYLSDIPIPNDVGDYRLLDKKVVDFLNHLNEKSRFLRGLVSWGGFSTGYVYFEREKRHAGSTHYTISKMINLGLDGIASFSIKPLRLAIYLGFFSGFVGFLGIMYAIFGKLFFYQNFIVGWTGLFVGIMFIGGVQLITIGIIGEYIGKIYQEVQKRPKFMIKEKINL